MCSKIDALPNDKGFMAEGITINLDGPSNLEDGGTVVGDATVEDFIPDGDTSFIVSTMIVYEGN